MKGWDDLSFERLSGVKSEYFEYPLIALQQLIDADIDAWPAVMGDLFGTEGIRRLSERMEAMGLHMRIEREYLERYPYVVSNLRQRGWTTNGIS